MLTMDQLTRMRVYVPRKPSRKDEKKGVRPEPKKLGKVHCLVFSPDSRRVVGLMVKRPDIAGMIKQEDRFLALDSIELHEGGLVCVRGEESFDVPACRRMDIDLDQCIIWGGCDVVTQSGKPLGHVLDARFSEAAGDVDCFCAQEGATATAIVGNFEIPAAWVVRYSAGKMIVRDEAATLQPSGGLAGKAGEGYAAAKEGAKKAAEKAGAAATVAVDKGSHGLGRMIGKARQGARRMASDFNEGAGNDKASAATAAVPGKSDGARKGVASGKPSAGGSPAARGGSSAKKSSTGRNKVATKGSVADNGQKAARAVGEQLGKTKGMFSSFLSEFKDASK